MHGYPTVYVLDHKGVIRLKFTGNLSGSDAKHKVKSIRCWKP